MIIVVKYKYYHHRRVTGMTTINVAEHLVSDFKNAKLREMLVTGQQRMSNGDFFAKVMQHWKSAHPESEVNPNGQNSKNTRKTRK